MHNHSISMWYKHLKFKSLCQQFSLQTKIKSVRKLLVQIATRTIFLDTMHADRRRLLPSATLYGRFQHKY